MVGGVKALVGEEGHFTNCIPTSNKCWQLILYQSNMHCIIKITEGAGQRPMKREGLATVSMVISCNLAC